MSGGIDSPVAAYRLMQRGAASTSCTSVARLHESRERRQGARLGRAPHALSIALDLWVVPFGEIQSEIVARVPRSHRGRALPRMMLRIAEALGRHGARVLVTGESLGQVSSQTLENMQTIAGATSALVLRPLVGMDKNEIIHQATRIGTLLRRSCPTRTAVRCSRRRIRRRARRSPRSRLRSAARRPGAGRPRVADGGSASASFSRRRSPPSATRVRPPPGSGSRAERRPSLRDEGARDRGRALAVLIDGRVQLPHRIGTDRAGEGAERGEHVRRFAGEPRARQQDRVVWWE
jgi:hypothetical protein